jgi:hypothetical protein
MSMFGRRNRPCFTPLQEFLRPARAPVTAMSLSELDGFLTGVAIRPDVRRWQRRALRGPLTPV